MKTAKLCLILTLTLLLCLLSPDTDSFWPGVVSLCVGDADGDGLDDMLLLTGGGCLEEAGLRYADMLLLCDMPKAGQAPVVRTSLDLTRLRPLKIQLGDIDGDGRLEIALCVYKETTFDPQPAMRPFFYRWEDGDLAPVWRGSRLARPFDDYRLADLDGDGRAELVSVEALADGGRLICVYRWRDFGFEWVAESNALPAPLTFETSGRSVNRKPFVIVRNGNARRYTVRLENNELTIR